MFNCEVFVIARSWNCCCHTTASQSHTTSSSFCATIVTSQQLLDLTIKAQIRYEKIKKNKKDLAEKIKYLKHTKGGLNSLTDKNFAFRKV